MDLNLEVKNLSGGYGKAIIVKDISFRAQTGDVLTILGPNGCGKSTLLKLLLNFLPKRSGEIYVSGQSTRLMDQKSFARMFSYIPQSESVMFSYTAREMVSMARTCRLPAFSSPSAKDEKIAEECMERLEIGHISARLFNTLSGGERQLVLIARALCQGSCIMVMDEPTANLDFYHQKLVLDAIRLLSDIGKIVLMTTHSPSQPFLVSNKTLLMRNGGMAGFGPPEAVLTPSSLESVFGLPMDVLSVKDRLNNKRHICIAI